MSDLTTCPYCTAPALKEDGRLLNHTTKDGIPCRFGNVPPDLIPQPGEQIRVGTPPPADGPDENICCKLEMLLTSARAGDVTDLLYIAINKNGMDLEANYTGPNLVYVLGELEVLKARLIATAVQVRGGAAL